MKKISAFLMGVSLAASMALAENTATSVNAVGFTSQNLPSAGKLILVGVPFNNIGSNSTTLEDMLGTNQLRNAVSYANADRVLLWDNSATTYRYFAIKSSDLKFHSAQNSTVWTQAATNPVVTSGTGLWIWSPASSSTTNNIIVKGEVVASTNLSLNISEGLNLLSHMFTCGLNVNESNLTNSQAVAAGSYAVADQIYVWDSVAQGYHKWALKVSDRKWHYADNSSQWTLGPVTNIIAPGEGFWYRRMTNYNMTWTENNPYVQNLK